MRISILVNSSSKTIENRRDTLKAELIYCLFADFYDLTAELVE